MFTFIPSSVIATLIWMYMVNRGGFAKFLALSFVLVFMVAAPFAFFTWLGFPMWPWIFVLIFGIGGGIILRRI